MTTTAARIAESIRPRIISGELAPGMDLPTVSELAQEWNCTPATVKDGLAQLVREGLTTAPKGRPHRVRVQPPRVHRDATRRYREEKLRVTLPEEERAAAGALETDSGLDMTTLDHFNAEFEVIEAPEQIANWLNIPVAARVLRRIYTTRHAAGAGTHRAVSHLPYDLICSNPDLLDSSKEPWPGATMHQLYTVGIEVAYIVDHIEATRPTPDEASEYDIPPDWPVLRITKVSYDTDDRPVEVTFIPLPADRATLTYTTTLPKLEASACP